MEIWKYDVSMIDVSIMDLPQLARELMKDRVASESTKIHSPTRSRKVT